MFRDSILRIALVAANGAPGIDLLLADPRRGTLFEVEPLSQSVNPDWILVAGSPLSVELLAQFPSRIISLHAGDVRDALLSGAMETRTCAHIAEDVWGAGPLLLQSGAYRVPPLVEDARQRGDADLICDYAEVHRQWMIRNAWGPMLVRIVEMLSAGAIQIVGDVVWVDGAPGPCRMGEAPAICHEEIASGIPRSCPFISSP